MSLVFDTAVLIDIENREPRTLAKLKELVVLYPGPGQITFVTYFEFLFGLKEKSPKNKERALAFLNHFECVQTTKMTAQVLAGLKHNCERAGKSLPLADLLIAAQVIENGGILVTRDTDFERIRELRKIVLH